MRRRGRDSWYAPHREHNTNQGGITLDPHQRPRALATPATLPARRPKDNGNTANTLEFMHLAFRAHEAKKSAGGWEDRRRRLGHVRDQFVVSAKGVA